MEGKWSYGTTNRVCVQSDADAQFSSVVSAIRNQHQDGIQVEGAFLAQRFGRDGRGIAAAEEPFQAAARGGSVRNSAFEAGASGLGAAQDPGVVFAWHGEVASESTFKRVLERTSLTQKRRRRRAPEAGRLSSGRQAAAVNEVWTVDFKGWWRKAEQRCEPLTVRDEYSRYLLEVGAVEDARSETVRKSFERIFERHGLPEAIRRRSVHDPDRRTFLFCLTGWSRAGRRNLVLAKRSHAEPSPASQHRHYRGSIL